MEILKEGFDSILSVNARRVRVKIKLKPHLELKLCAELINSVIGNAFPHAQKLKYTINCKAVSPDRT